LIKGDLEDISKIIGKQKEGKKTGKGKEKEKEERRND
jgi:hypothetical protein